ncbi:MAG: TonB-dependent receptor [Salibacteraceae bacterium]
MRMMLLILLLGVNGLFAQNHRVVIYGAVKASNEALPFANVYVPGTQTGTVTDERGQFVLEVEINGRLVIEASHVGYETTRISLDAMPVDSIEVNFRMSGINTLNEIVVSGTLREMSRLDSPVPVEVYSPKFIQSSASNDLYEALQNVNGVRPQMNCNVCNTGDIHINGLEGPYTMVLIDGMPIVSGLATVYGFSGIPAGMIERVEVVKGPASLLYGSEAVGGLINIITKSPKDAPRFYLDLNASGWMETNADLAFTQNIGQKIGIMTGFNIYHYANPVDNNGDGFTDIALRSRLSLFEKIAYRYAGEKEIDLAIRYLYEDRWGGQMAWTREFRGSDSLYAESIYTNRFEAIAGVDLPTEEKLRLSISITGHRQQSFYGTTPFIGYQGIGFGQLTWTRGHGMHQLLSGLALRRTHYDDNTVATGDALNNNPELTSVPGVFVQDEIEWSAKHTLLTGLRYDYHLHHGHIVTPRVAWKFNPAANTTFRLNAGSGYRVVSIFTEDHAALTGSRDVILTEAIKPERSYNVNANLVKKIFPGSSSSVTVDGSAWYTYFTNKIVPDYDSHPNRIIYSNLDGYAVSKGLSINLSGDFFGRIDYMVGATLMDVFTLTNNTRIKPVLTEQWSGNWSVSYSLHEISSTIDYTGSLTGPMRLPLAGPLDPRPEYAPWWSLQNLQFTYAPIMRIWEVYLGMKNILNFTPPANSIARAHDPFDKLVEFDEEGIPVATAENPFALTFDPSYAFAPNQGRRIVFGFRIRLW